MTRDLEQRIADKYQQFQDVNTHCMYLENLRASLRTQLETAELRLTNTYELRKQRGAELSELRRQLAEAAQKPYLKKDQLEDGATYEGACRNASKAIWRAQGEYFDYVRIKFGMARDESIEHIDDCEPHEDGFIPYKKVE